MMINNNMKNILAGLILMLCFTQLSANINPNRREKPSNDELELRQGDCTEATAQVNQDVNNVRARLTTGGDVWWDPNITTGRYVVPAVPEGSALDEVSSIFAAAVWLGGFDTAGNCKVAATDYRTGGSTDFYPGPIMEETGETELEQCQQWDRFFEVQGSEVDQAIRDWESLTSNGEPYEVEDIPEGVRFWPGNDNPYFRDRFPFELPSTTAGLGAYWDEDFNGIYDPAQGDFPIIDIRGCEPFDRNSAKELIPDEMIFWIYNDIGNTHSLTQGDAIRMEVQVQSFAYATNDQINDMTFQRYKLINRATDNIRDTYFGWWTDADLGCSEDDYAGADVGRSLAYTYNEDVLDGQPGTCDCGAVPTYCDEIPMIGTDYFRGPLGPFFIVEDCSFGEEHVISRADEDFDDDIYAVGDTICITPQESTDFSEPDIRVELGMSSFIYYNRGGLGQPDPQTVDPQLAEQFYNYLTGRWLDGTPLTAGGTGFNPGSTDVTPFAFPDPPNQPGGWSMAESMTQFGDRRTVQASGPFVLKPGDRNELIVGAVWVPNVAHPRPSLSKLLAADDVAQNLFDNCFDIVDGPDAPDMCTIELDREIIIVLTNDSLESNNAFEQYSEIDILSSEEIPDSLRVFEFEGYQVYQLVDQTVSPQELDDVERAILVAQVDVQNGVSEIFNWESAPNPISGTTDLVFTPTREVDGEDEGIRHTFSITTDAFSSGEGGGRLINHTTYFYMVVAYAYNNFATFDQQNPGTTQMNPYLEGRSNIMVYSATPRPIVYQGLNAQYGDGIPITRKAGIGVGTNVVDLDDSMYETILNGDFNGDILYEAGAGPIDVQIFNPLDVRDGVFQLQLQGTFGDGSQCGLNPGVTWVLTDVTNNVEIASEQTIDALNEQIITEYGFSVSIGQSQEPGERTDNNGALAAFLEYSDPNESNWFIGVRDEDSTIGPPALSTVFNFLQTAPMQEVDANREDPNGRFGNVGDGYWYPYHLSSGRANDPVADLFGFFVTPGWKVSQRQNFLESEIRELNNVDIIFTSDKSLWSECIVVETATEDYLAVGSTIEDAEMFDLRQSPSIDANGNPLNDGTVGKSFFPGYAVDVETGQRLNIFFGENSIFTEGQDLIYNPSDLAFVMDGPGVSPLSLPLGGHHYIYVTRQEYDGCDDFADRLQGNTTFFDKIPILESVTWTSMSLLATGEQMLPIEDGLIPNDLTVKLRVENPYNLETAFNINAATACVNFDTDQFPLYEFELNGLQAVDLTQEPHDGILADVNVVPNPYYAFSSYEINRLDKAVKITNVPDQATVTIYSLDGKFIQEFRRDERPVIKSGANPGVSTSQTNPDIRWNLENFAGIPISSGVYLIHIAALGEERTLKWFGVNRQFDANGL